MFNKALASLNDMCGRDGLIAITVATVAIFLLMIVTWFTRTRDRMTSATGERVRSGIQRYKEMRRLQAEASSDAERAAHQAKADAIRDTLVEIVGSKERLGKLNEYYTKASASASVPPSA